ncbi:helix-turn-helix domain-containing protein [Fluviicola taffensis]|uniref:Helix-turn-helix domain-containing protein n=1 Tax=Fluviicola taffensis (strain DSM 16823 / NCIMB 13979 / RW262) TaxID=755732 RepID=F2IEY3_FLUTR|nr:helix-turn-helix domain-containing protein [Fluviicola taffensis]AEA42448.1 hypothetical protein Fluta_0442 [Fluviicola taffensis DSM 16823]
MQVITMESETFKYLIELIEGLKTSIDDKDNKTANCEWLDNQDVCQMLKVTPRTLQNYRDQGKIGFTSINSKIFYRKDDIEKFLMDNYKAPFKKKWLK